MDSGNASTYSLKQMSKCRSQANDKKLNLDTGFNIDRYKSRLEYKIYHTIIVP